MKRLFLLRHAKSDRSSDLDDFDRHLNARGRRAAPKIAEIMHQRGFLPDVVLSSPSRRTRETWELIAPELGFDRDKARLVDQLYLAPAKQILDLLRQLPAEVGSAMVIGHNPGLEDIAARLASEEQSTQGQSALAELGRKYPTCALTVLDFPIANWAHLQLGAGAIVAFITPASLAA